MRKITGMALLLMLLCSGCALTNSTNNSAVTAEGDASGTGFTKADSGIYDSADTAVLVHKDEEKKTVTFMNAIVGRTYTLKYDGTTVLYDKYEQPLALSQIVPGDIVDVTFMKMQKRLNSMKLSGNAWKYESVDKFELGNNNQSITIGQEEFKLDKNVTIFSNEEMVELIDLNARDTVVVKGIDHTVYSIAVGKGHGYLRLINDEYFVGGWIEVGQKLIQPVTEGMLLAVPEGTYQVLLTNNGIEGTKEVTIERDGEVELDVGDIKAQEAKFGKLIFHITPSAAVLYIDGEKIDDISMVSLEYGIHQMIAKAEGYNTITQYIKVGQELATIELEMEEEEKETEEDADDETPDGSEPGVIADTFSSNNTVSGTNLTPTTDSLINRVLIEAPEGVEVYVDGAYAGVTPVTFPKKEGSHMLILRKTGYQTKTYTIQLDGERKDISYSFSDLLEIPK